MITRKNEINQEKSNNLVKLIKKWLWKDIKFVFFKKPGSIGIIAIIKEINKAL